MIIIRPNKPLPLLSANQHFGFFAFLSSCKGNIASSMEAERIRQLKHSLTRIARPPRPGHRGLDTTPRANFWNGSATHPASAFLLLSLSLIKSCPPSDCLLVGGGSSFQRLLGHLSYRVFSFVFTLPWLIFCSLMFHIGLKSMVATSGFADDFKAWSSLPLSLKLLFSLPASQYYSHIFQQSSQS